MAERVANAPEEDEEGVWGEDWDWEMRQEGGRDRLLAYIQGLVRAQERAWAAAEGEIAEAIFVGRYSDPSELWGELAEREGGLSWDDLARWALFVSRETARKRFRDRVEAIREERERARQMVQDQVIEEHEKEVRGDGDE